MVSTSRPTCRKCGAKIFRSRGNFRWSVGNLPLHCWRCGESISGEQLQHLQRFENFQCCLSLIILAIVFVIVPVIYFAYR